MIGDFVILRTKFAGVHVGILKEYSAGEAVLTDARRVWRWRGANSLHELSLYGCDKEYSRISEPVNLIAISEVIERIPCSDIARENLRQSRWAK